MSGKHVINADDLYGYQTKAGLASSIGQGSYKHLDARIVLTIIGPEVTYHVTRSGKTYHETKDLESAVKAYNDLP